MPKQFLHFAFVIVAIALSASPAVAVSTMYGGKGIGLYNIDQTTANETIVGLVPDRNLRTLTSDWRASSFRLWAIDNLSDQLLRLDPNTGLGTPVGPISDDFTSIAYDVTTDQLYALANNSLYRVDSSTAATTLVGPTGISVLLGIAFDNSGTLYSQRPSFPGLSRLVTLNKSTGAGTLGATISGDYLNCFAFRPEDNVMFAAAGDYPFLLYQVDTTTGIQTLVSPFREDGPSGLAFSTVPEPSVLPFAILALALRRKSRRQKATPRPASVVGRLLRHAAET